MTDRSKLLALAARTEALTGPDREVDAFIWCHTMGIEPRWTGVNDEMLYAGEEGIIGWVDPGKHQRNFQTNRKTTGPAAIPPYTASLDAAMTLVPKGWTFANLSQGDNRRWWCELRRGHLTSYDKVAIGQQLNPLTPALALCAAALRAQAEALA